MKVRCIDSEMTGFQGLLEVQYEKEIMGIKYYKFVGKHCLHNAKDFKED